MKAIAERIHDSMTERTPVQMLLEFVISHGPLLNGHISVSILHISSLTRFSSVLVTPESTARIHLSCLINFLLVLAHSIQYLAGAASIEGNRFLCSAN
jgi:hypothetical protein